MKQLDLRHYLESLGCQFVRGGASHTVYINPLARKVTTIPRHREVTNIEYEVQPRAIYHNTILKQE